MHAWMALLSTSLICIISCSQPAPVARNPLEGAWTVVEARFGAGSDSIIKVLPGQFIFLKTRYSAVWSPQAEPRVPSAKRYETTEQEMLANYRSIYANTGAYEINGSRVTIRPTFSKLPEFTGGYLVYEFRVEGDFLFLEAVEEKSFDNVAPSGYDNGREFLKLQRVE
jgi:hypothetical protein